MITEDYVSFETAKLLKEKGFDECCNLHYHYNESFDKLFQTSEYIDSRFKKYYYPCPTLQMTMKWLREEHSIAISVYVFNRDLPIKENRIRYTCDIATTKISSKEGHLRLTGTYEQACEAAIKYCLENLI